MPSPVLELIQQTPRHTAVCPIGKHAMTSRWWELFLPSRCKDTDLFMVWKVIETDKCQWEKVQLIFTSTRIMTHWAGCPDVMISCVYFHTKTLMNHECEPQLNFDCKMWSRMWTTVRFHCEMWSLLQLEKSYVFNEDYCSKAIVVREN